MLKQPQGTQSLGYRTTAETTLRQARKKQAIAEGRLSGVGGRVDTTRDRRGGSALPAAKAANRPPRSLRQEAIMPSEAKACSIAAWRK